MSTINREYAEPGGAAAGVLERVTMPRSEQRTMRSRAENREYRIFIAVPEGEAPPSGFPVVYVLDANSVFGTMVEAVRVQSRAPERTGVIPAIVVGIGYPTDGPFHPARHYDFTREIRLEDLPFKLRAGERPEHGGAEAFMAFIEDELKPRIEETYPVDRRRQTIFGHSLGGLFVLHMLYAKPEAFQCYVAGSPSIHWNKQVLLEEERAFASKLSASAGESTGETADIKLFLAIGELEKSHHTGGGENAAELCERLSALSEYGMVTEFKEFEGEGHVSVLPPLISRAVRFALRPEPTDRQV
ncbi:alpha/beta hydrolase [Paenibacillus chitinolyticus]|uniref:alpha/beta hydrolase n=1 Tax=Paenibacillus chitinolyticus TaxID=79263 RepID=UPI003556415E